MYDYFRKLYVSIIYLFFFQFPNLRQTSDPSDLSDQMFSDIYFLYIKIILHTFHYISIYYLFIPITPEYIYLIFQFMYNYIRKCKFPLYICFFQFPNLPQTSDPSDLSDQMFSDIYFLYILNITYFFIIFLYITFLYL